MMAVPESSRTLSCSESCGSTASTSMSAMVAVVGDSWEGVKGQLREVTRGYGYLSIYRSPEKQM
jgi:hypothetical protein